MLHKKNVRLVIFVSFQNAVNSISDNARYLRFFGVYKGVSIARGELAERYEAKTTNNPRKCGNTVLAEHYYL